MKLKLYLFMLLTILLFGMVSVVHAADPVQLEIGIPIYGSFNYPSEVKNFLIELPEPGLFSLKFNYFVEFNTDLWKASLISIDESGRQTMIDIFYVGNHNIGTRFESQTQKVNLPAGRYLIKLQPANSDWQYGWIYDGIEEYYRGTSYRDAMRSQYSMMVIFEASSEAYGKKGENNSYTSNLVDSSKQALLEIFDVLTENEKEQLINFGTLLLLLRTGQ